MSESSLKAGNSSHDLLTEEELSALLEIKSKRPSKGESTTAAANAEKRSRVVPYNFRRPDRVSKEQVRSLYLLHDTFARNVSSSLPILLRAISEVALISIEQQTYVEYLYGLTDPNVMFTVAMPPLEGASVLQVSPSIAFPIIDRQLGGPGHSLAYPRALTEIEKNILEGFLKVIIESLQEAWKPILDVDFQIAGCETCPQLLQIVAPNEIVITVIFHVRIGE
ncbi:MAG: flagellar motor switch protein FliM, partial [Acidobacteriota bacterium]